MKAHTAFASTLCVLLFAPLTVVGQTHSPGDILFQRTDGLSVGGDDFTGALPDNTDTALPFGVLDDPNASIITQINVDTEGGAPAHGIDLIGDNFDLAFTFQLYDSDGQFSFTENFDDRVQITITPIVSATDLTATGGSMVHSDVAWNVRTFGDYNFASGGWFDAQVLMTEDGGGAQSAGGIGFGFSNAASTANEFDYALVGGGAVFDTDGNGDSYGSLIISFDPNTDTDGDGIPDGLEVLYFPGDLTQLGTGDFDGDGVNDPQEIADGTDPTEADADGDGLNDGEEKTTGTDPHNADSDGDGLSDGDEVNTHGTDPNNSDTDGDGSPDAQEIADGGDPNNPNDAGFFESFSFDTDDGGFTQEATGNSPIPSTHDAVRGTWAMEGDDSGPATNTITSPEITMPTTGGLQILFSHRFNIETEWDGTALQFSRNGDPFVTVPIGAFTQNEYTFSGLIGNHVLSGEDGFNGISPGYAGGTFITSVANFGSATTGDTFQVRFLGAWDEGARGPGLPNWEIDSVSFKIRADTDGDGMPDDYEGATAGLDKNVDDAAGDLDGEGVSNLDEFLGGSDPNLADTDDDGSDDAQEAANGTDPTNPDTDGDGLNDGDEATQGTDPLLADTDGDGFPDGAEVQVGTDPLDPDSHPALPVPIGYWPADEGTGTTVANAQGDTNLDGTLMDGSWGAGHTGNPGDFAFELTGVSSSRVAVPPTGENFSRFTITGWIKGVQTGDWTGIFQARVGGGQPIGLGFRAGTGELTYTWNNNNGNTYNFVSGLAIPRDEWAFVAITIQPDQATLWVGTTGEGAALNSATNAIPHLTQDNSLNTWNFGIDACCGTARNFDGLMDDIAIWNDTLRPEQIESLWDGSCNPLGCISPIKSPIEIIHKAGTNELEISWDSAAGFLYTLHSETDLSAVDEQGPGAWPIYNGHEDLVATPPRNVLTFPFPADSERFFAIEAFPAPPVSILSDDFESGQGGWTTGSDGAAGTAWELGIPTNGPGVANSLVNCFGT
ncbi:MAG: hypothetical protein OSA48_11290, partial [Akkermansiaceae bacterium]|nr:hypothetical protein [Akkermansiaceae bacterium]